MSYTAVINALKVLLPLLALALLSTVFLFARVMPEEAQLPFIEDLRKRVDGSDGMRASFYTGQTEAGDAVSVEATSVKPDPEDPDITRAQNLRTKIDYVDGSDLTIVSETGAFSDRLNALRLTGEVVLTTSSGYVLLTDELYAEIDDGRATSPSDVRVEGPSGTIDAGHMVLTRPQSADGSTHLVFTNGVKVVYDRQRTSE